MPVDAWGRTWCLAFALFVCAIAGFEVFFRQAGFEPSLTDGAGLWCLERSQLRPNSPNEVALLGSSRVQCGLSSSVLAEATSRHPVQLAVAGSLCLPVLEHLSNDPSFVGTVVCELFPGMLATAKTKHPWPARQAEYVRQYESRSAYSGLETNLRAWVQQSLVSRLPELGFWSLIRAIQTRTLPVPDRARKLTLDRCMLQDASQLPPESLINGQPPSSTDAAIVDQVDPQYFAAMVDRVESLVRRIQDRGGSVVFIRMPASGRTRMLEDEMIPRADEWDRFAARTSARCIHYADDRVLSKFSCPDGSHLDARDVPAFTRRLAWLIFGEPGADSQSGP